MLTHKSQPWDRTAGCMAKEDEAWRISRERVQRDVDDEEIQKELWKQCMPPLHQ